VGGVVKVSLCMQAKSNLKKDSHWSVAGLGAKFCQMRNEIVSHEI